jgi:SAM-dependent methyltransferase
VDGGAPERWSAVADEWSRSWGTFAAPVWEPLLEHSGVGPGTRVLDVGSGSGELLAHLSGLGAVAAGVDPAPEMREVARRLAPGADVRDGDAEHLPFADASLDVVVAVNALQFADDPLEALAEIRRVLVPGGAVGVANWAEAARNDLDVVERAVAAAHDDEVPPDGELRLPGGLEALLTDAGLDVVASGVVAAPWRAADAEALVRGILFGEDPATTAELASVVVEASRPFRHADGGYELRNALRYAVARASRKPSSVRTPTPVPPLGV